ncbi:MAG TPA: cysteine hydrolase, partial [Dermatophilaceae bacterium]
DAAHRGLAVEFLSDATGTLALSNSEGSLTAEQLHQAVLVILHSRFAVVATTVEWVEAIATGRPLEGSSLYASTEIARGAMASR